MKLEVGMYVRTEDGRISKVTQIKRDIELNLKFYCFEENIIHRNYEECELKRIIKKASNNIIDLIEDEDIAVIEYYVSKYRQRITRMFECSLFKSKEDEFVIFENKHCDWWYDKNKKEWARAKGYNPKIKSIVTKEQFSQIEYKVD